MRFSEFAQILQNLEQTASRNELANILVEFFKRVDVSEVHYCLYFMQGRLGPLFETIEFNMSRKSVFKAIEEFLGQGLQANSISVKNMYAKNGDAGLVAQEIISNIELILSKQAPNLISGSLVYTKADLEVTDVYKNLRTIAEMSGKGSQNSKAELFINLLLMSDALSAKYITRIITGELRLGVSEKTILDALSIFKVGDKTIRLQLDKAFGFYSDIGFLSKKILQNEDIESISLTVGVPLASKLVEREKNSTDVWKRMPFCFVQPKLDGLRGQIHFDRQKNILKVFSRNMEDMTAQFPEILRDLTLLNCDSVILDAEIIGYDLSQSSYMSYGETMQRKRKYDIDSYAGNFPVRAMCFDILYINGKDISHEPLENRLSELTILLKEPKDSLHMLETLQMNSEEELDMYFKDKIYNGLEGIITKMPGSVYEPGTRNFTWIKLKANSQTDLVDTIDVTVMGYYVGRGQRAQFGIGALLAGVYDPEKDTYYSIGKVGSGMTEAMLEIIQKDLSDIIISEKPENYVVDNSLFPEVWVQPRIVMEIIADEITRSPNHTAARGISANVPKDKPDRGLSIRFPRIKIWKRDKVYPNTVEEIVRMYELRKGK